MPRKKVTVRASITRGNILSVSQEMRTCDVPPRFPITGTNPADIAFGILRDIRSLYGKCCLHLILDCTEASGITATAVPYIDPIARMDGDRAEIVYGEGETDYVFDMKRYYLNRGQYDLLRNNAGYGYFEWVSERERLISEIKGIDSKNVGSVLGELTKRGFIEPAAGRYHGKIIDGRHDLECVVDVDERFLPEGFRERPHDSWTNRRLRFYKVTDDGRMALAASALIPCLRTDSVK